MAGPYAVLVIKEIQTEANGVKTFTFEEPIPAIDYLPGQYLTFILPTENGEIRRSYSITSAPILNEPLTIGVKRISNGLFSRHLFDQAQPGDQLLTTGAAGFFTLPDDVATHQQIFFLAAGSGITPIFSLIKTVLFQYPKLSVVLIYSNRSPEETIFKSKLEGLSAAFPNRFHLEFLFSDSPDLAKAHLYQELLVKLVRQLAIVPPVQLLAYTCGPKDYMRMGTYGLRQAGVPLSNIKKELFNTDSATIPNVQPPDVLPHRVTIRGKQGDFSFSTQYPTTILQSAKNLGIRLPYSCEAGQCGSCAAQCLEGEVWMSYNQVLTEKDMMQGLVLTCVGYPVGGDVVLKV